MKSAAYLGSFTVIAVSAVAILLALIGSASRQGSVYVLNRGLVDTQTLTTEQTTSQNDTISSLSTTLGTLSTTFASSVSNVTSTVSSGTLRWFSNCQAGTRSIAPDFSLPFSQTYASLSGKPETSYTVSRVDTPSGVTSLVLEFTGPDLIDMTDADSTKACRAYAVSDQPYWVDAAEYTLYKFMGLRPQDYASLDPPCDGTTCRMRDWTLAYFRSTEATAAAYIELHMWTSSSFPFYYGENVFVARNMTFTTSPIRFTIQPSTR